MSSPIIVRSVTSPRSEGSRIEPLEARITPGNASPLSVVSIDRFNPSEADTGGSSVTYRVVFGNSGATIFGVDAADFQVVTTGDAKADPTVVVSQVDNTNYNVLVTGVQGNGTLRLDLVDNDTIVDGSENDLGGFGANNGSFSGEIYDVLQTMPTVNSITRTGAASTSSGTVSWTVSFSEDVDAVDSEDFGVVTTGATTWNSIDVTPVAAEGGFASSYTVTVSGVIGAGTIGLNLQDNETIRDLDNNPLQTDPISFAEADVATTSGSGPWAMATADLNDDGIQDLVVVNAFSNSVSVLLGNNDGSFQSGAVYGTSNNFPVDVATADFDGDGDQDLVVAGSASGSALVSVLTNNGSGAFSFAGNFGFGGGPLAVTTADLNRDGNQDIAVSHTSGGGMVNVLLGNGNGGFASQGSFSVGNDPASIAAGDIDDDGDLDLVTGNRGDNSISVLLGNGSGQFAAPSNFGTAGGMSPAAVAIGDLNKDGRLDVVATGDFFSGPPDFNVSGKMSVFLGASSGTFSAAVNYDTFDAIEGVGLGDFDGDGILDVAVVTSPVSEGAPPEEAQGGLPFGPLVLVFPGVGDGSLDPFLFFALSTQNETSDLVIGDWDRDGKADVATGAFDDTVNSLLNNGVGDFTGEVYSIIESSVDLTVSINDIINAAPGSTVTYTFNYANLGSASATGVTLTVTLDDTLNFTAGGVNAGWIQNGNLLTRTIGNLAPTSGSGTPSVTLALQVDSTIEANTSGFGTTVTIDGTEEESNEQNNQASDFASLTGLTRDLRVTDIEDPNIVVPGRFATFTIHYSNVGNLDISEATIEFTLPPGTSLFGPLSPGWSTSSGSAFITVDVPAGGADQTVDIVLDIGFIEDPTITTTAEINAKAPVQDGDSENDTATEETPVYHGFVVTAPGIAPKNRYAPPVVQVFDRLTGDLLYAFTAYEPNYRDSIRVATGDLNGDGVDDIVTTTQHRGGRMRFFDGLTGERFSEGPLSEEVPVFGTSKNKGAFVAVGNVIRNFEGIDAPEIIVGSSLISTTIGGGTVKVYSLDIDFPDSPPEGAPEGGGLNVDSLELVAEFKPFGNKFKGGVRVAVGDVDLFGNGKTAEPEGGKFPDFPIGDIIVGQGYRGNKVRIYEGVNGTVPPTGFNLLGEIQVGGARFRGGVSVAAGDVNDDGRADVIVGRNSGKPSIVEVYDGRSIFEGSTPEKLGGPINPFDSNPEAPKNAFGVRVASADVNGDGVADIITSVGIRNQSLVKFFISNVQSGSSQVTFIEDESREITAYSDFLNVALWVAASSEASSQRS